MIHLTLPKVVQWPEVHIVGCGLNFDSKMAQIVCHYKNGEVIGEGFSIEIPVEDFDDFYANYNTHDYLYTFIQSKRKDMSGVIDTLGEPQ